MAGGAERRLGRLLVFSLGLLLAASTSALTQAPGLEIDFPFLAADTTLQAGTYSVDIADDGKVVQMPEQGRTPFEVAPLKKLSDRKVDRPELVFDVVGSARFLSEVKVPGKGVYLVSRRGDAQERETVKGPKPGK